MAFSQKLDLRQGQSLVMTPQLQQAIKLLQMSNFELQEFIETELEKNPLLEKAEPTDTAPPGEPTTSEDTSASESALPLPGENELGKTLDNMDTDLGNVYADEARADTQDRNQPVQMESNWSSVGTSGGNGRDERSGFNYENVLTRQMTLPEFLNEQLSLSIHDPVQRLIGRHLVGMINEAGYLSGDLSAVAEKLGTTQDLVSQTLEVLQTFEPTGVFARDLSECLRLQLKERDRLDPAMAALLENLDLLARRDFAKLKKICGVDLDDIYEMVAEIRELDPKPGLAYGEGIAQPVIPDVIVRPAPDGTWIVELNSETLPKVLVNNQYYAQVSASAARDQDKVYISECHNDATWLVKSLEQRARTILAVSREIIRQQDGFLVNGISALKPLNLRDVAEVIEMHESTVSRVTSNKYIETPRGIFELKYFFTTALAASDGGEDVSAEAIRHQIRQMVDAETADTVLSDDAIVSALKQAGIEIARRTVAKYRVAMKIPSSVQRRREKKAFLSR